MTDRSPQPLLRPWLGVWRFAWRFRHAAGGAAFPVIVFLIGTITVAAPYFIANNVAALHLETLWDPEVQLDRDFPVINWMVIPYAAFYLLFLATLALTPRDDRGRMELAIGLQALSLATWLCVAIFLVMPAEVDLREQLAAHWEHTPPSDFQRSLFSFIHASDAPWNAWPSLHIVHSYLLVRLMTRWLRRDHWHSWMAKACLILIWSEWSLLCVSVMATKQHYVFDLITGGLVAHAFWLLFRRALRLIDELGATTLAVEARWIDPS